MRFVEKCDELCILLSILSFYSIYRLQPLNISLFSPLSHYYSADINILIFDNIEFINLFKRVFWSIFYPVWIKVFTPTNIASGFTKTGIFPYNSCIVFNVIIKPTPLITSNIPVISKTSVLTYCMQKIYKNTSTCIIIKKLILKNKKLTA